MKTKQRAELNNERLRRLLEASPDQQELVDRILEGRPESETKASSDPKAAVGAAASFQGEDFIDKPVVAERMGMSVRSVDNFMRLGLVPFYRLGRRVMFKWSEIEAHLEKNCRVCNLRITK